MYSLGKQNHFNKIFKDKKEKYTYLVPSDQVAILSNFLSLMKKPNKLEHFFQPSLSS
jgi:hypothetical protein